MFLSVSLPVMHLHPAKAAERIDVLCGMKTPGPKEYGVRRESRSPHWKWEGIRCGRLEITLATCYGMMLVVSEPRQFTG